MHSHTMHSQSSPTFAESPTAVMPRALGHKRRRDGAVAAASPVEKPEDACAGENCGATSGESSSDESDSSAEFEEDDGVEEEALAAAKRRRRADLDGLKQSVRHMEAQVVDASAQLRDLAALVAQVVARRQQLQQSQLHA
ncbi:hypothetical protein PHYPSEUDO_005901 [Phytophthora pseudosyringae]|uniref:Uncharacterized protein n=1 Tax=Phytophthora pseudosyringae TaxID=221518 RepID=A0A8T1WFR6_9STRA|nr:hypothetical protein PHYPSEUDO_005901 [Phytophthora pseudosyringae]